MTREQALRKVMACLRLAGSANPTEAATALRHARSLMEKYGLNEADAAAAEIREAQAVTGYRGGMIPRSMLALAAMVADGYRCELVVNRGFQRVMKDGWSSMRGKTVIRFFGAGADAQVASYAFTVLRRQLHADKTRHTSRIRKRANKDARGEEFAAGWIAAVRSLFPREELPEGRASALALAIKQRCGETSETSGKEIGKTGRTNPNDKWAGYEAGKGARLNVGINGAAQRQIEAKA